MSESKIEWTERTWNPIVGCSILTPGCTNCYAMKMAARLEVMGNVKHYAGTTKKVNGSAVWTGKLALAPDNILLEPLKRKKPTTYFVNSMGDLFHEDCPNEWIDKVNAIMALCPQHTFQVLTKRAERMRKYYTDDQRPVHCYSVEVRKGGWSAVGPIVERENSSNTPRAGIQTLPNVWLGVSTERQQEADERIPHLLQTPAAVRFISAEPLLGPISLNRIHVKDHGWQDVLNGWRDCKNYPGRENRLDWVIVGGESGNNARPFNLEWAHAIVDQCRDAGVPCFVKQLGSAPMSSGYPHPLKSRKGGDPAEWPDRLNVRAMPKVTA